MKKKKIKQVKSRNYRIVSVITSIVICLLAGFIGSIFTSPSIPTWFASLKKPVISPPNWIFGPVWTTLYILMGIAAYLVWDKGTKKKPIRTALYVFAVQLILNTVWSILFFGLHSPALAFIEIVILWTAIMLTIVYFFRVSKPASYLLIPYICWVSFAAVLNLMIWIMNM